MNPGLSGNPSWIFGAATADITPTEPILLTGYLRDAPANEVRNPIHVKAAYFRTTDGEEAVIVNADVIGFSRELVQRLNAAATDRYDLPRDRVIFSATHNHSGPVISGVLPLFHDFSEESGAAMERYTETLFQAILDAIGEARAAAEPCRLAFHMGLAGFAVNRRRAPAHNRHLPTVVDQDVPVLTAINRQNEVRGILFGYACHTTVMFDNSIDGDYSGYAQAELEKAFPHCTAVFLAGCGGDINPLPRRRTELSVSYGHLLATAVIDAMGSEKTELTESRIRSDWSEIDLPLEPPPGIRALETLLQEDTLRARVIADQFRPMPPEMNREETERQILRSMNAFRRKIHHQLDCHRNGGPATEVPFPLQVLELGGVLRLVALAGEPTADYSLRLKERHGFFSTWPLGYCNELVAYIPSRRVLREGGYEGKTAMLEYGLPSPFQDNVESLILFRIERMINELPAGTRAKTPVASDMIAV